VEESDKLLLKSAKEMHKYLSEEVFPDLKVGLLHGKMPDSEKDEIMRKFSEGEYNILVSTTVIEVGIDVPNATVMMIENPERFGLAQLHQLRGRVGRGSEQSYCVLVTKDKLSKDAHLRINAMLSTNDGFKLAEMDLRLRGPGDIFGTAQSGFPFLFKIANLSKDGSILQLARSVAEDLLREDPELKSSDHLLLASEVAKEIKRSPWGMIS
jgi:ATP-dependent DNA helicase RecG